MIGPAANNALHAKAVLADRKRLFTLFRDLQLGDNKEWLVKGLLGHGEASAFYGKPGDGKSVLVQDLCMHVAAGWPWHDRPVRRGGVVYIALERRKLVERRALAFRQRHDISDLPLAIVGGVYDFRDRRTADRIIEITREVEEETGEPVVLIVIDTLSRALCGGDENSPKDMGAIVNASGLLHQGTGAHILWVHHMPLDGGERMRGHGALLGAMDTTVHVVKADRIRSATVVKANDSEEGESVAFILESVTIGVDSDGIETTAPIVVPAEPATEKASTKPKRKMSDRQRLALQALTDATLANGKPVVPSDDWREELFRRGILERAAANPRANFKRIRDSLAARNLIGVRNNDVWACSRV
jgi:RecA-family ATPase